LSGWENEPAALPKSCAPMCPFEPDAALTIRLPSVTSECVAGDRGYDRLMCGRFVLTSPGAAIVPQIGRAHV
jgi:hypothetical protein